MESQYRRSRCLHGYERDGLTLPAGPVRSFADTMFDWCSYRFYNGYVSRNVDKDEIFTL